MTSGTATVTLFTSEEFCKLITDRFPSAKGAEMAWGLPYIDGEGCVCIEIAFSDEGVHPEDWGKTPLAVKQYKKKAQVENLLLEDES